MYSDVFQINEKYGPHTMLDTSILSDTNYIKNIGLEPKVYNQR